MSSVMAPGGGGYPPNGKFPCLGFLNPSLNSDDFPIFGENLLYIADEVRCFFNCAQKTFWGSPCRNITTMCRNIAFLGFVQKYYCPGTKPSWEPVQGHFWARAEILVSRRNIHLCPEAITDDIFPKG